VEWASQFLNLDKDELGFQKCLNEAGELVEAEYDEEQKHPHRDLLMAPFLSGERSTGFRDGAVGAIFGLTRETTPAHFLKSCLEGVSLRLKAVIDLLLIVVDRKRIEEREDGNPDDKDVSNTPLPVMVASGKAMEVNNLWRQMIADSSGLKVVLDEDTAEGTSRGVTRLVAMSLLAEKETTNSDVKVSVTTFCNNETDQKQKRISLAFSQHEEELHPFLTSEPRPIATATYARKSRLQEGFIDSITPFFYS
jgi:sugar (pentulose or hexulose) kinase